MEKHTFMPTNLYCAVHQLRSSSSKAMKNIMIIELLLQQDFLLIEFSPNMFMLSNEKVNNCDACHKLAKLDKQQSVMRLHRHEKLNITMKWNHHENLSK